MIPKLHSKDINTYNSPLYTALWVSLEETSAHNWGQGKCLRPPFFLLEVSDPSNLQGKMPTKLKTTLTAKCINHRCP